MLTIKFHKQFKKDYKKLQKRGLNVEKLRKVIEMLADCETLPKEYKDHPLVGNYKGYRECHIQPDWLLVYKVENDTLILTLFRTGTHSDIFKE